MSDFNGFPNSNNVGLNWTNLGQFGKDLAIESFCFLKNGICLAGTGTAGHILRSTDYGPANFI